jgi:hypothetical protein
MHEGAEMRGFYGDGRENSEPAPPVAVVRPDKGVWNVTVDGEVSDVWEAFQETEGARMEHQCAHRGDDVRTRRPRLGSGCIVGDVREHQDLHRIQIGQETEDTEELWVNRTLGILGQHNRYNSEMRSECRRARVL